MNLNKRLEELKMKLNSDVSVLQQHLNLVEQIKQNILRKEGAILELKYAIESEKPKPEVPK